MKRAALFSILLAFGAPTVSIAQSQQTQEQQNAQWEAQRLENDRRRQEGAELQRRNMLINQQAQQQDIERAEQARREQAQREQRQADQEAAERSRQAQLTQDQRINESIALRQAQFEQQRQNMLANQQAQQRDIDMAQQARDEQVRRDQRQANLEAAERQRQAQLNQAQRDAEWQAQRLENDRRRLEGAELQRQNQIIGEQARQREIDQSNQSREREAERQKQQQIRELQVQRNQLQAEQDARAREQARQNASLADQQRLEALQQQRNELQAQADRRQADEARLRQEQARQREYLQAQTDAQAQERETERQKQQQIRDLQLQRNQLQAEQDARAREQARQHASLADQQRLQELQLQRNQLQAMADARARISVQQDQTIDTPGRSNQGALRLPTKNYISSNSAVSSPRSSPIGLDERDQRWVQALPPQLQSQLRGLSPAEIDTIKSHGNWQRVKEAFTQSGSAIRSSDVAGQREQIAIWEKAWGNFKTTLDYGSLALGVGEGVAAYKTYRAVQAERSAILVARALGSTRESEAVAKAPLASIIDPKILPEALTLGRNANQPVSVYLGIESTGKVVYCGISCNLVRRSVQHGDRFSVVEIAVQTQGEALAIEEALFVKNPQFQNIRHPISPDRPYYKGALAWGNQWLKSHGY